MRLYLIDALYHIYRAYHALPSSLRSPQGQPLNALHGVLGTLRSLMRSEPITHCGIVFESFDGIFREQICADYKASRELPPEALTSQIPLVQEACHRLGLRVCQAEGFEADDLMATLAQRALQQGLSVSLVSADKDLAQILALPGDIELLRWKGRGKDAVLERLRQEDVPRVFGVRAEQMADFQALRGDPVDNIRGLAGVGPKTAARWLALAGSLEELLLHPEQVGPRWSSPLREGAERLRRDRVLTTLRYDVPLPWSLEDFRLRPLGELVPFFEELGMRRHAQEAVRCATSGATALDLWSTAV